MTGVAFYEIVGLLVLAALAGMIAVRLRQPLIIAFIAIGILSGPALLGWTTAQDEVALLAELGIAILLFLVGLKLDFGLVKNLGLVALATGLGQLTFTIAFGYLIALALGLDWVSALYVAIALTFSSTIIIVKLLSDKREIDSLHGRIAMGFLIVQDIAVVIAMATLGTLDVGGTEEGVSLPVLLAGLVGAAFILAVLMRWVLPRVLDMLTRSQDLLVIFAVAWGVFLAAIGDAVGFSREIGAFLGGFSLASTGYREAIGAKLASLRDFLLLFFFVDLGARLEFVDVSEIAVQGAILSVFILVGNPLIVMAIMGALGYRKRTGFFAGLTVAQISEFSLIFIALGVAIGHIPQAIMGLVTVVGLTTITLSTYLILYSHRLYPKIERWLAVFERGDPVRERRYEELMAQESHADVVIFGLGRLGRPLVERFHETGLDVLGVEFDPELVRACRVEGLRVTFGDAGDPDLLLQLGLARARWVISTLRDRDVNIVLIQTLRRAGFKGHIAVMAHSDEEAGELRSLGASDVWIPYRDAAEVAASRVGEGPGVSDPGPAREGES